MPVDTQASSYGGQLSALASQIRTDIIGVATACLVAGVLCAAQAAGLLSIAMRLYVGEVALLAAALNESEGPGVAAGPTPQTGHAIDGPIASNATIAEMSTTSSLAVAFSHQPQPPTPTLEATSTSASSPITSAGSSLDTTTNQTRIPPPPPPPSSVDNETVNIVVRRYRVPPRRRRVTTSSCWAVSPASFLNDTDFKLALAIAVASQQPNSVLRMSLWLLNPGNFCGSSLSMLPGCGASSRPMLCDARAPFWRWAAPCLPSLTLWHAWVSARLRTLLSSCGLTCSMSGAACATAATRCSAAAAWCHSLWPTRGVNVSAAELCAALGSALDPRPSLRRMWESLPRIRLVVDSGPTAAAARRDSQMQMTAAAAAFATAQLQSSGGAGGGGAGVGSGVFIPGRPLYGLDVSGPRAAFDSSRAGPNYALPVASLTEAQKRAQLELQIASLQQQLSSR